MERTAFLRIGLVTGALQTTVSGLLAKALRLVRTGRGFKIDTGKDRFDKPMLLLEGDTFLTKIATQDTDGDMFVFESIRVKEGGPSHHVHFEQDEWWYVLQGKFLIKVGDEIHQANAGDSVFGPRNVPHSFAKVGDGEARLLMIFQPAGKMEEFFRKLSEGVAKTMSEAEQDQFREAHGFKRVGPPIAHFKKW